MLLTGDVPRSSLYYLSIVLGLIFITLAGRMDLVMLFTGDVP